MNHRSYTSLTFVGADGGKRRVALSYSNLRSETSVFLLPITQGVLALAGGVPLSVIGQCECVCSGEDVIQSPEALMSLGLAV
jgi:hypothetical protein